MKQSLSTYDKPYVGCLLGSAYHRLISRLEECLRQESTGITAPEYLVLRALYSRDGLQQCDICEMVGKDKGAVSRTVGTLAHKGLVTTECVSHKCTCVWLTPKARQIEPVIMRIAGKRHKALEDIAPKEDIETMINVLQKIINNNL
ncbi:MAG: MarR family winged helix-turn-helix transcriptional regulator [Muribaculaceae bacterium]|nr:MarR family winged helix-turn-helix transcriptional regulator [Muribaculaceae bacterium]